MHILHRAGARKGQRAVEHARVAAVGVAQGVGGLGVPGQAGARDHHQRAPAGRPEGTPANGARAHFLGLAVDQVGGGVAGVQRQLVQRETLAGGHGVRPGHVLVEADGDRGEGADAHAHHVHAAGDGEVHFVEAIRSRPREMRVAQQHAAAIGRHVLAEGPGVGAQGRVQQTQLAQRLGRIGQVDLGRGRDGAGGAGLGRLRAQHAVGQRGNASLHGGDFGHAAVFGDGHRPHPGLAAAGRRQAGGVVAQVAVVALDVAAHQRLCLAAGLLPRALQRRVVHVRRHEQVDLLVGQVAPAQEADGLGPEAGAALAARGDQLVGHHAHVVLGVGVGHAIGQGFGVFRRDVRDAKGGAGDGDAAVARRTRSAGATGQQSCAGDGTQRGPGHGSEEVKGHGRGSPEMGRAEWNFANARAFHPSRATLARMVSNSPTVMPISPK